MNDLKNFLMELNKLGDFKFVLIMVVLFIICWFIYAFGPTFSHTMAFLREHDGRLVYTTKGKMLHRIWCLSALYLLATPFFYWYFLNGTSNMIIVVMILFWIAQLPISIARSFRKSIGETKLERES